MMLFVILQQLMMTFYADSSVNNLRFDHSEHTSSGVSCVVVFETCLVTHSAGIVAKSLQAIYSGVS